MTTAYPSSLPPFNYHGYLPEGIHDATWQQLRERFVFNPKRTHLWERLERFHQWSSATSAFAFLYIDGGFIASKAEPEDIDVILQPRARYGAEAFAAMEPFFAKGLEAIYREFSVHLHFWCDGFPGGVSDFRVFFQYLRPQDAAPLGLKEAARKGIVRVKL